MPVSIRGAKIEIPQGCVFFELFRLKKASGKAESGRKWQTWKPERLYGEAGEDGRKVERWPIAELSPVAVREVFGVGRYRVRFLAEGGEVLSSVDWTLETPRAVRAGSFKAPSAEEVSPGAPGDPDARMRAIAGRLDSGGALELMFLMREIGDQAAERTRAEAERAAERDRAFAQAQQASTEKFLTMILGKQPAPGASLAASAEAEELARQRHELLKRELSLTMREELAKVATSLQAQIEAQADDDDDDDEPDAPPKTVGEALDRVGAGAISAIEAKVPGAVDAAVNKFMAWAQSSGTKPTPELAQGFLAALRATAEAEANGVKH